MPHIFSLRNVQTFQTLFLTILICLGIVFYNIHYDFTKLAIVFATVMVCDMLFYKGATGKWRFPASAINIGFGISFFLRTDLLILYVLAGFLGVASKYFFRIEERHFFNPSNFGVFLVLAFFPEIAWTNPLQWGKINLPMFFSILALILFFGSLIVWKVKELRRINLLWLIIPFVLTHFSIWLTMTQESTIHSLLLLYTPSFFIFMFFMMTDPQTLIEDTLSKILFGMNIAVGFYFWQNFINENYSLLASLFFMTLFLPLVRWMNKKNFLFMQTKIAYGNILLFLLFICFLGYVWYIMYTVGPIDLVFDNRCNRILCQ